MMKTLSRISYLSALICGLVAILEALYAVSSGPDATLFGIGRSEGIFWILGWFLAAIWSGMGAFWYALKAKGTI